MRKLKKFQKQIIFLMTVLFAGGLIASLFLYQKGNEKREFDYSDYMVPIIVQEGVEEIERSSVAEQTELSLDLLKKANSDVVAIIEFDDRMIYEPIVQAGDNDYYVRRNLLHQKVAAGISFIDCDSDLKARNTVIYGHSSVYRNIIFTPLMNYKSEDFYFVHPTFQLKTEEQVERFQIFSVFLYDTEDAQQIPDFVKSNWNEKADYAYFLASLKERSIYATGVSVDSNDKILTLVTCDTEDSNSRLIVIAKRIE